MKNYKTRGFYFDFLDSIEKYSQSINFISDNQNQKGSENLGKIISQYYPESLKLLQDSILNYITVIDDCIDWIDSNPNENFDLIFQEEEYNSNLFEKVNSKKLSIDQLEKINLLNESGDKKFVLEDYQGSIKDYSEALKINPENKEILKKRSDAYKKLSELDINKSNDLDV